MGTKGECSRDKVKTEILLFAADQKKYERSKFIKELIDRRKLFSKNTVYKYLDELVEDKLMIMEPGRREDSVRQACMYYSITKTGLERVDRTKLHSSMDSFDIYGSRWVALFRRLVKRIEKEKKDPYAVFNEYCFTFIDDEPIAFSKGYAEYVTNLDRRIRTRYSYEFDTCMERCMGDKRTSQSIGACLPVCKEEIGRTVGEYWRKLKKKAEKLPFPQRMWVVEGYSEEELEKMLAETENQYSRKQKKKRKD